MFKTKPIQQLHIFVAYSKRSELYLNVVLLVARQHEKSKTEEAFPYQVQSQVKLELLALLKQIFEHKNNYCFSFGFQLNPLYFTVYFREDKKSQLNRRFINGKNEIKAHFFSVYPVTKGDTVFAVIYYCGR